MGRAPSGAKAGPQEPAKGAAGSIQSKGPKRPNATKKLISAPVSAVAHAVTGLSSGASEDDSRKAEADAHAGKQTAGVSADHNMGVAYKPSKNINMAMHHAQTAGLVAHDDPGSAAAVTVQSGLDGYAGACSTSLASRSGAPGATADTSSSKRAMPFRGNNSSIDSLVFGADNDDSANADKRDFSDAAGNRSSTAEMSGIFAQKSDPNKAFALKSTADAIMFGRDVDGMDALPDPRDFDGAAGNRSSTADLGGMFAPENDRIRFADIPKSTFAAPGLRKVDAMGSRAEEIIYGRAENPEDSDHTDKHYYHGAGGETSVARDQRLAKELLNNKKKLKSGTSSADKLIFGYDLDNSEADDDYEAQLYSGAGTRSNTGFNHLDMSTRNSTLKTDSQLYGCNVIVGTDLDGDEINDPRDFSGYAGNSTKYLAERTMSTFDISKRTTGAAAGSSAVNPSEADELIFGGRNIDKSAEDTRNFDGAAGSGARLGQRNTNDITATAQRRMHEKAMKYGGADQVMYGYALHKHDDIDSHAASLAASKGDALLDEGMHAGHTGEYLDQKAEREANGAGFRRSVTEKPFDLITGGNSSIVSDLIDENPEFEGAAGVTSAVLDLKKVEDHKRIEEDCVDMVPDPNNPPGTMEVKGSKSVEFAKLHAATMDTIIYNRDLDGSDGTMLREQVKEAQARYGEHAGLSSEKIAGLNMSNIDQYDGWGLKMVDIQEKQKGAAGRAGSTAVYETRSRRQMGETSKLGVGGKDNAATAFDFTQPPENTAEAGKNMLKGAASKNSRANFAHHSQSERVGMVVFGQAPPEMFDPALSQPLMDQEGTVLKGTRDSDGQLVEFFNTAAGSSSRAIYHDLQYKLDDQPARPRLHMMSEVDTVVFGHDVDGSDDFKWGAQWGGAGKSSTALQEGRSWKRRDIGRRENAGTVDEVVFGHDIDLSKTLEADTQVTAAAGPQKIRAAGASSSAVLSSQHLNDPRARMHYPPEMYMHAATGNEESIDRVVFDHAMDLRANPYADSDVVFPVSSTTSKMIYGSSGNKSGDLNRHHPKIDMQKKRLVPIYDTNRAEVDEIIYGRDLDPKTYTEADVEELQYMRAGKSSVTKELEVRSESKKMVPHEHGHALALLFPAEGESQVSRAAEEKGNGEFENWQTGEKAAGNTSVHNAHLKFRELEFVDGAVGTRPGRSAGKPVPGAAGKKVQKEQAMQTKSRIETKSSPKGGRAFGKPSGLKSQSESTGVAFALNQPIVGSAAYEQALAEGREMLNTPYTGINVSPSRTEYDDPSDGIVNGVAIDNDAAGNYRKQSKPLVSKPRPEGKFGASSPFGVDPVNMGTTNSRFTTSAASVGGIKKDRVLPFAIVERPPAPTGVIVPAAGQRPKVPTGRR